MVDLKERKKKKNLISKKVINKTELSGVQKNLSLSNKKKWALFRFLSDDFLKEMLFRHMMFLLFHMPYDMG